MECKRLDRGMDEKKEGEMTFFKQITSPAPSCRSISRNSWDPEHRVILLYVGYNKLMFKYFYT